MVLSLQHAAEDARQALKAERKQVEGELSSVRLIALRFALWGSAPNFFFPCSWLLGLQVALGNSTTQAQAM
jgi:hypothetical protein